MYPRQRRILRDLSGKTVQQLYEENLVTSISGIYDLRREDVLNLEGWKEKKTDNLLSAIEASKDITLDRFIFGLGIRNVGQHIASILATRFGTLEKIMSLPHEELIELKEVGPEIAESVIKFFKTKDNIREIEKLLKAGITIRERAVKGKLSGKKVVFTGSLESLSRSEAKKLVESEGGEVLSSVSAGVDFVVAGDKAGSKLDIARKKNVQIITEKEFFELTDSSK